MMEIAMVIVATATIIVIEVPRLWKKKLIKELWVFFGLISLGVALGIMEHLGIRVPSLLNWMIFIYKPIRDLFLSFLN